METAIIIFHIHKEHRTVDLEVPLDLTAKELAAALNRSEEHTSELQSQR